MYLKNVKKKKIQFEMNLQPFTAVHAYKTKLKTTKHEKVRFIKLNELKSIQVELFSFLHFMCVAANDLNCFVWSI